MKIFNVALILSLIVSQLSLFSQERSVEFTILDSAIVYHKTKDNNTKEIHFKMRILNDTIDKIRLYWFNKIVGTTKENPFIKKNLNKIPGVYFCLLDSNKTFIYGNLWSIASSYLNKTKDKILFKKNDYTLSREELSYIELDKVYYGELYPYLDNYINLSKGHYFILFVYNLDDETKNRFLSNINIVKKFTGSLKSNLVKFIVE